MIKIIINADDCGYNKHVNSRIENAIIQRKISSSTIMANMDDFEGALALYNKYNNIISFGYHLNLTEGSPLTYSQKLLDIGFLKEQDDKVVFNTKRFHKKFFTKEIRKEIYKEVSTQAEKLLDNGIKISHIDGHHFFHQAVFMLPLLPDLCKSIGVHKIRNYNNYQSPSINRMLRNSWSKIIWMQDKEAQFTDYMEGFYKFHKLYNLGSRYVKDGETIELMTHPGGANTEIEELLLTIDAEKTFNGRIINYNDL